MTEPLVKPFAALIYREPEALEDALARLAAAFSPVEQRGAAHPFDLTDYYAPELGEGLRRVLAGFARLESPGWLVPAKQAATAIEDALRTGGDAQHAGGDAQHAGGDAQHAGGDAPRPGAEVPHPGGRRRVNIDVGYVDLGKVVLASGKGRPTKLYLERGVWADLTLTYAAGRWHPLPWSFPDFRAGRYDAELLALRTRYKAQLRERG